MPSLVKVLGFAGSLRRGSYNRATLRAAGELLPEDMRLETFDLAPIPLFNQDILAAGPPRAVLDFKARLAANDGVLIVTPEYNYSIPGVLKNAIDWASRPPDTSPLNGKPVGLMGASTGQFGTVRAQTHWRNVFVFTNMLPLNKPEVLINRARDKFDAEGRLTDEPTRQVIRNQLVAFGDWVRRLRGY
ncbi:MAG: NAD(P)H-dependent oxidoreductase [Chloroflexi bacterium]|nr:NAD(P)H-dependent oxidoreductase [Chloroflexota bacterium]